MSEQALLIDVSENGHVKLALTETGVRPEQVSRYVCNKRTEFSEAVTDFLARASNPALMGAAVSACGWEQDGELAMPNDSFRIERAWLREFLNVQRLNLVNDCVSKAMAVDKLKPHEILQLCGQDGDPTQPKLLIGASAGLGTALIVNDDLLGSIILPSEGGHSDLPAVTSQEKAVLAIMERKFGRVSRERAVSLEGLEEIWRCLCILEAEEPQSISYEEILDLMQVGKRMACDTVSLCTNWLAATCSDAALMTGARGGLYLTGDLIDAIFKVMDHAAFVERFQDKGRLKSYVADIPIYVVLAKEPALIGLGTLFK